MREFHWLPKDIGSLFIDDEDYLGIIFWYNDAEKAQAEATAERNKIINSKKTR